MPILSVCGGFASAFAKTYGISHDGFFPSLFFFFLMYRTRKWQSPKGFSIRKPGNVLAASHLSVFYFVNLPNSQYFFMD